MRVRPDNPNLNWWGMAELVKKDAGYRPVRAPGKWRSKFLDGAAWRFTQPAGIEIRFESNTTFLSIEWFQESEGLMDCWEVVRDGELIGSVKTEGRSLKRTCSFGAIAGGDARWEIRLPWSTVVELVSFDIDDGATLAPWSPHPGKGTIACYGDSITHGYSVTRPSLTWPYLLQAETDRRTLNFGLGGAAFCEREVGEYVASRNDWDSIVIAAGINTAGSGFESAKDFDRRYDAFLDVLRKKHPDRPILCYTPMFFIDGDSDANWKNPAGDTIEAYRDAIRIVFRRRATAGDGNLHLMDGMAVIGPHNFERLLADVVHPNDEGMKHVAREVGRVMREILGRR